MKKLLCVLLTFVLTATLFASVPVQAATVVAEGIDVSYWQGGSINWNAVASHSHGDFAILRAYCYGKDTYFDINYDRAKAAGVPVGAYCYIYGTTTAAVQSEINALLSVIQGKQFEYPIYIDVEDTATYGSLGVQTVTDLVKTACQMLEDAGYFAGVYTYTSFAASYIDMTQLTAYTTWIADYRGYVGYTGDYAMWQYGCEGSVGGISPVDVNYSYMDFPTIIKSLGLNNYEPSVAYPYDVDDNTRMLHDGENKTSITTAFGASVSVYGDNKTQGDHSLKLDCTDPAGTAATNKVGGMAVIKFTNATDLSDYNYIQYDVYVSRKMTGSNGLQFNFISDTTEDGYNLMKAMNDWQIGWHTVTVEKSAISKAVASADWSNINKMRICWFNFQGSSEQTYFLIDNVVAMKSLPTDIPYPYVVDSETLMLNDGEDTAGVIGQLSTSVSVFKTNKTEGKASLKLNFTNPTENGTVGGKVLQNLKEATDMSAYDYLELDLYCSRNLTGSHGLQINFGAGNSEGYKCYITLDGYEKGWHTIQVKLDDLEKERPLYAQWRKIDTLSYIWHNLNSQTNNTYFLIDNFRLVKGELVVSEPESEPESQPESQPEPIVFTYGDVNEDNAIDAKDALQVLKYSVGKINLTKGQLLAADVDGKGGIDAKDALLILKYSVHRIDVFPAESM